MYDWRNLSPPERAQLLHSRLQKHHPWHSPPHRFLPGTRSYLLTAANFNHNTILGLSSDRMDTFTQSLLQTITPLAQKLYAWVILPNHYHLLVQCADLQPLLHALGQLHGQSSYLWNGQDHARGRKVWHNSHDREMRSLSHLMASINYLHHNPVKHHYVSHWQHWPWSSAPQYLADLGHDLAAALWKQYPITTYGNGWDDPEL